MEPDEESPSSFAQEYDPRSKTRVNLHIYCRLCRRTFPVTFKPRRDARLRCVCGHETRLAELDVFKTDERARDFAKLYEKIYRAAKDALKAAHLPMAPSGRMPEIRDGMDDPSDLVQVSDDNPEDLSDVRSSYVGEGSDVRGEEARDREQELREAADAAPNVLAKHEALSELVEHLYCVRNLEKTALDRFEAACREDMAIAAEAFEEARRRKRAGENVRLAFTSFKHLAIVLEEDDDIEAALGVVRQAMSLGLGGYDERAARLEKLLAKKPGTKPGSKKRPGKLGSSSVRSLREDEPQGLHSSSSDAVAPSADDFYVLDEDAP